MIKKITQQQKLECRKRTNVIRAIFKKFSQNPSINELEVIS